MKLQKSDALIVVDMQNDFITGSLAVPGAREIIPQVNELVAKFRDHQLPIFYTTCWHPEAHCSFKAQGGPWPPHCVAGTYGAQIVDGLEVAGTLISKGAFNDKDAYSGFDGTPLHDHLQVRGVTRVLICGLATDYCVSATALDAIHLGYETTVVLDAVRGVEVEKGDVQAAQQTMWKKSVRAITVGWVR